MLSYTALSFSPTPILPQSKQISFIYYLPTSVTEGGSLVLLYQPPHLNSARLSFMFACYMLIFRGFPGGSVVKNLPGNAGDEETQVPSLGWKIPWRRAWQPTPVFLPEKSHGQRSLAGYNPKGPSTRCLTM